MHQSDSSLNSTYEEYAAMKIHDSLKDELSSHYKTHLEQESSRKRKQQPKGEQDTFIEHFQLINETDKAVLLQPCFDKLLQAEWLPRSQILLMQDTEEVVEGWEVYEVTMNGWIARKKGWLK